MHNLEESRLRSRRAHHFILLLGLVSLFADATYESARSILGQFLATLGATGASVGLIAGLGELLSYGLRVFSGRLSDRMRWRWRIALLGFSLNMLAVPLLALAQTPAVAAALTFAERTGKAIRNPPRDAMLSSAARRVGAGRGFGLQEALGQIGAIAGPLLIGVLIARGFSYRFSLGILVVPAVLTLVVLCLTRWLYPDPGQLEPASASVEHTAIPRIFWPFLVAGALIACGSLDFALIAYALVQRDESSSAWIPPLYAIAMITQALAALGGGQVFDRRPAVALVTTCLVAIPVAALAFQSGHVPVIGAMVLWGVGVGAQKAVFKATISKLVPIHRRALAFGAFFAAYGMAWFIGSMVMGRLLDLHPAALVVFSLGTQALAVPLALLVTPHLRDTTA